MNDATSDEPALPMRDRLVAATVQVLVEEGPSQLKARRIADAATTTTISIYHHFGGVPELLDAVVAQGYSMLRSALVDAAAPFDDDPVAGLFSMALAARDLALTNPHLYDMMFGLSTRGTYRSISTRDDLPNEHFSACFAVLVGQCQTLIDMGAVTGVTATPMAAELWSAVHGYVGLETAGLFVMVPEPMAEVFRPMMVRLVAGMGHDSGPADASAAAVLAHRASR